AWSIASSWGRCCDSRSVSCRSASRRVRAWRAPSCTRPICCSWTSRAPATATPPDRFSWRSPTASLDPDIADKTRRLPHAIRRERGLAILYSSHNMSEVEEACDAVVFIHHGRVVADGTPLAVSRRILGSDALDAASMEEVFLKISRGGAA